MMKNIILIFAVLCLFSVDSIAQTIDRTDIQVIKKELRFKDVTVDSISTDSTLSNAQGAAIVTDEAIKKYVDSRADTTDEIQDIELNGTELSITKGSTVNLSGIDTKVTREEIEDWVAALLAPGANGILTKDYDDAGNLLTLAILDRILTLSGDTLYLSGGNAVYLGGLGGGTIEDDVYGAGWDGDLDGASKNAIYDKIETLAGGHDAVTLIGEDYLDLSGQEITADPVNLSGTHVTGVLPSGKIGTHTHTESDITDLDHYTDADIDGTEAAFTDWDKDVTDDVEELTDLTDVNTATPTNRHVLIGDGVDFESRALTEADISDLDHYTDADIDGTEAAFTNWDKDVTDDVEELTDLTDVNTATPTNRHVLIGDGVDFESRALTEADISDLDHYTDADIDGTEAAFTNWDKDVTDDAVIEDDAYGAGWNGDLDGASKNAIYDKIEALPGGHSAVTLTGEDYLDLSGQEITADPINLSGTHVTGVLPSGKIGTHTHTESDITDLDHYTDADIDGTEAAFTNWDKDVLNDTLHFNQVTKNLTFAGSGAVNIPYPNVSDAAYGVGWDGDLNGATKNAIYDKIEALPGGHSAVTLTGEDYLDLSGQEITADPINLSGTHVTGVLPSGKIGTHTHTESDITDLDHYTDADIDGTEAAFTNWDKDVTDDVEELTDLTDVNTATPTNRHVLIGDGVDFESRALTEADISDLDHYTDADIDGTEAAFTNWDKDVTDDAVIEDDVYGAGWNGDLDGASKNAIYDKIEALPGGHSAVTLTGEDYLDLSGQEITADPINLSGTHVTGVLPSGKIGTHTHTESDITDLDHYTDADIDGTEAAFTNWDKDVTDDVEELTDLTDVNTATPTNRHVLIGDGVDFESRALTEADISDLDHYTDADIDGTEAAFTNWDKDVTDDVEELTDLTDVNTATPTNRHVLIGDGVDFESRALTEADISDLTHTVDTDDQYIDLLQFSGGNLEISLHGDGFSPFLLSMSDYVTTTTLADSAAAIRADFPDISGFISATGTPVANQLTVFNGAATVVGDPDLTFENDTLRTPIIEIDQDFYLTDGEDVIFDLYNSGGAVIGHLDNIGSSFYLTDEGNNTILRVDEDDHEVLLSQGVLHILSGAPQNDLRIWGDSLAFDCGANVFSFSGADDNTFEFWRNNNKYAHVDGDNDFHINNFAYVHEHLGVGGTPDGSIELVIRGTATDNTGAGFAYLDGSSNIVMKIAGDGEFTGEATEWIFPLTLNNVPRAWTWDNYVQDAYINNVLHSANLEYTVTATNTSNTNYGDWFDGSYEASPTRCNLSNSATSVITVDFDAKGNKSFFVYPTGKILVHTYSGHDIDAGASVRWQDNLAAWTAGTYNGVTVNGSSNIYEFEISGGNYMTAFELTLPNTEPTNDVQVMAIEYFPARKSLADNAVFIKNVDQTLYNDLTFKDDAGSEVVTVSPNSTEVLTVDGNADFNEDVTIDGNAAGGALQVTSTGTTVATFESSSGIAKQKLKNSTDEWELDVGSTGLKVSHVTTAETLIHAHDNGNLMLGGTGTPAYDVTIPDGKDLKIDVLLDTDGDEGTDGQILSRKTGGGTDWITSAGGGGLDNVVEDLTPELGGYLAINSKGFTYEWDAGATLAALDLVTMDTDLTDGELVKANATDQSLSEGLLLIAQESGSDGVESTFYAPGSIITGFSGLTPNKPVYISTTAGQVTTTPPSTTGHFQRIIGHAKSATTILFNPSPNTLKVP